MSKKRNVHIVSNPKGGWDVKRVDSDRASSHHDTQKAAIDAGKGTAQRVKVELVIHDKQGRIRDKDSFGNDPFPPKDLKH